MFSGDLFIQRVGTNPQIFIMFEGMTYLSLRYVTGGLGPPVSPPLVLIGVQCMDANAGHFRYHCYHPRHKFVFFESSDLEDFSVCSPI